jgi:histidine triad (HIT) family protein
MMCIFCQIVNGEIACHSIYEDDKTLAFMDVRPINSGHVLVVPKRHGSSIQELNDLDYSRLMLTVKQVGAVVQAMINPKKVGVVIAGFDIDHLHVQVVPMHDYHDVTSQRYSDPSYTAPGHDELARAAERLKKYLSN